MAWGRGTTQGPGMAWGCGMADGPERSRESQGQHFSIFRYRTQKAHRSRNCPMAHRCAIVAHRQVLISKSKTSHLDDSNSQGSTAHRVLPAQNDRHLLAYASRPYCNVTKGPWWPEKETSNPSLYIVHHPRTTQSLFTIRSSSTGANTSPPPSNVVAASAGLTLRSVQGPLTVIDQSTPPEP